MKSDNKNSTTQVQPVENSATPNEKYVDREMMHQFIDAELEKLNEDKKLHSTFHENS